MVVFPEKRGEVGGQTVHKLLPLLQALLALGGFQPLQIHLKRWVARLAQAPRQAAVNHGLFALVQTNARSLVNQSTHARKVSGVEGELPVGDHVR